MLYTILSFPGDVRGGEVTDRFPAKGSDEGRVFMNSRNEVAVSINFISGILRKSSKIPSGFSGLS